MTNFSDGNQYSDNDTSHGDDTEVSQARHNTLKQEQTAAPAVLYVQTHAVS